MENGNPEIKNGNPVYLGVPLLFRRLLKKGGGLLLPGQHYIMIFYLSWSTYLKMIPVVINWTHPTFHLGAISSCLAFLLLNNASLCASCVAFFGTCSEHGTSKKAQMIWLFVTAMLTPWHHKIRKMDEHGAWVASESIKGVNPKLISNPLPEYWWWEAFFGAAAKM